MQLESENGRLTAHIRIVESKFDITYFNIGAFSNENSDLDSNYS
jgi:hypothetical protein